MAAAAAAALLSAAHAGAAKREGAGGSRPGVSGGGYYRTLAGAAVGRGVRFNNPFRLSTQLGGGPESLSLTPAYLDLWLGVVAGPADGLQHGGVLHVSVGLDGIAQEVVAPGYLIAYQPARRWLLMARAGLPIVVRPDTSLGAEAAVGGALYLTAALGVTAEIVASLFYGAATLDRAITPIPIAAGQLGLFFDYEVLP